MYRIKQGFQSALMLVTIGIFKNPLINKHPFIWSAGIIVYTYTDDGTYYLFILIVYITRIFMYVIKNLIIFLKNPKFYF